MYSERKNDIDENYLIDEKHKYIDIPLTVSYEFGNGNIKFYPMLGLHNAFLIEGKVMSSDLSNPGNVDIKFFRYHMGYTAGFGNEFELSNKLRLFLEA